MPTLPVTQRSALENKAQDSEAPKGCKSFKTLDGGGRRTRTFEVIRRLIYSQLPLPLGTLPRSTPFDLSPPRSGWTAINDAKTNAR